MTIPTTRPVTYDTEHSVEIAAPPQRVYELIADVTRWPYVFAPTVHVELLGQHGERQRLRLWALANGEVRSWTSVRELDPHGRRISFRQEVSSAPVAAMGGSWTVLPLPGGGSKVVLRHDFQVVGGAAGEPAEQAEWITQATDRNSHTELAALKRVAELGDAHDLLVLSFSDSVHVRSTAAPVYDFLYRADQWPDRLPHVARLVLDEPATRRESLEAVQSMQMDTRGPDGSVHTTHSVRVCFPHERIVYKQTSTPPVMAAHVGAWTLRQHGPGVRVTAHHTVVIRPERLTELLGPNATVDQARQRIQHALSTNSRTTLHFARQAAEGGD